MGGQRARTGRAKQNLSSPMTLYLVVVALLAQLVPGGTSDGGRGSGVVRHRQVGLAGQWKASQQRKGTHSFSKSRKRLHIDQGTTQQGTGAKELN